MCLCIYLHVDMHVCAHMHTYIRVYVFILFKKKQHILCFRISHAFSWKFIKNNMQVSLFKYLGSAVNT